MTAPSEGEIDALFDATGPLAEAVAERYRRQRPLRDLAVAFGCLPALLAVGAYFSSWAARLGETRFFLVAGIAVALGLAAGAYFFRRFAHADAPVHELADRVLVLPLAARLVEGAVLSHPQLEPADWEGSRLLPETTAHPWTVTRVSGRIAGLPAVLDEGQLLFAATGEESHWPFDGWRVRLELPFSVAGHLRVRTPLPEAYVRGERRDGFAREPGPSARLGGTRTVEVAPPAPGFATASRPGDVRALSLVTDAVLEALSDAEDLELAATGRTLWIHVHRRRAAFKGAYRSSFDREAWRAAARSMAAAERLADAVRSAGTGGP